MITCGKYLREDGTTFIIIRGKKGYELGELKSGLRNIGFYKVTEEEFNKEIKAGATIVKK